MLNYSRSWKFSASLIPINGDVLSLFYTITAIAIQSKSHYPMKLANGHTKGYLALLIRCAFIKTCVCAPAALYASIASKPTRAQRCIREITTRTCLRSQESNEGNNIFTYIREAHDSPKLPASPFIAGGDERFQRKLKDARVSWIWSFPEN